MNKKETTVIVDGKQINVTNLLTTLQQNPEFPTEKGVFINVGNYEGLGVAIREIVGVCATSLRFIYENDKVERYTMYKEFGADIGSVATVLQYVTQIIPFSELQLLDEISEVNDKA